MKTCSWAFGAEEAAETDGSVLAVRATFRELLTEGWPLGASSSPRTLLLHPEENGHVRVSHSEYRDQGVVLV